MSRLPALFAVLLLLGCTASSKKPAASADEDRSNLKEWKSEDSDSDDSESESKESSSSDSDDDEPKGGIKYQSEKKLPPGPSCLNQQGDVQSCMNDSDCCKNFYCGFDPDGSARQKVCLYGGK